MRDEGAGHLLAATDVAAADFAMRK